MAEAAQAEVEAELAAAEARADQAEAARAAVESKLGAAEVRAGQAEAARAAIEAELATAEVRMGQATAARQHAVEQAEQIRAAFLASRSWKVTAPFRQVMRWLKREN